MMHALILAGSRGGRDPVAQAAAVSDKCLAPVAGRTMIERVTAAVGSVDGIEKVRIAASLSPGLAALEILRRPGIERVDCMPTPSRTVAAALDDLGAPLLVTTGDHPLLTPDLLGLFMERAQQSGADIAVGLVSAEVILRAHPLSRRTYLTFRGGRFSGANLFMLRTPAAAEAVRFWRRVENDRKKPWRIAKAFGPGLLISYLLRRYRLDEAMERASEVVGAQVRAVVLPVAEAAIDVDKPEDLELVETILERRHAA